MRLSLPTACLCLIAPVAAQAEGARLSFDCTDAAGASRSFSIAPVETDEMGIGHVTIGESALAGSAGGFFGPWSWIEDEVKYTLMVNGEDSGTLPLLLHALDTNTAPYTSTLTTYDCEVPT